MTLGAWFLRALSTALLIVGLVCAVIEPNIVTLAAFTVDAAGCFITWTCTAMWS